jgi:hypothetical protein
VYQTVELENDFNRQGRSDVNEEISSFKQVVKFGCKHTLNQVDFVTPEVRWKTSHPTYRLS